MINCLFELLGASRGFACDSTVSFNYLPIVHVRVGKSSCAFRFTLDYWFPTSFSVVPSITCVGTEVLMFWFCLFQCCKKITCNKRCR